VHLGADSYEIILCPGALSRAGAYLNLERKVLLVTDSGIPERYVQTVAAQCTAVQIVRIPQGEQSKSMEQFQNLLSVLLKHGFNRSDCVLALGGGVTGDLAGFVASCYLRGIDFYNVPTTLLAQIDSSVGGKTAVNFGGIKNSVGAFYQPAGVLIDPDVLQTLSPRLVREGLAEAVKIALTCDADFFALLERIPEGFPECVPEENPGQTELRTLMEEIILRSLQIKISIVEQDEKESGLRRVLNFGHTIGHAVESVHDGTLLHGECVSLGMLPMCTPPVRQRLSSVLIRLHLPTQITDPPDVLLPLVMHDKKQGRTGLVTVQVENPGSFLFREMNETELRRILEMNV